MKMHQFASFRSIHLNDTLDYCFALVLQWLIMLYFIDFKGTLSQMAHTCCFFITHHFFIICSPKPPFLCSAHFWEQTAVVACLFLVVLAFFSVKIVPSGVPFHFKLIVFLSISFYLHISRHNGQRTQTTTQKKTHTHPTQFSLHDKLYCQINSIKYESS